MTDESIAELLLIGIVDGDEAVGQSISSLVRSAGFRVAVFSSVEALLGSNHLSKAECLILDVRVPGIGDLELQERLAERACRTPIIFATAYSDDDERKRALDRGAVAFLHKPFGDEALFAAMRLAFSAEGPDGGRYRTNAV
jgi:FixJ family two-component response regulator